MKKEKTKSVSSWEELTKWLDGVNPFKKTIILSGYVNYLDKEGKMKIRTLVFQTVDVKILQKVMPKNGKKQPKKRI